MAKCPNKNLPGWQNLVAKVGEYEAMSLFLRNNESTPNIGRDLKIPNSGIVSYQQKINILKRLTAYNSKLGTAHRLKFLATGEAYEGKREYTYTTSLIENWNRSSIDQLTLFQDIADKREERDERIEDKMRVFLQNIGVEYKAVNEITDREGNPLGFAAKADMLNKAVHVVEDRAGIDTLPEEAAHFFVNILEAKGDPLIASMMNNIDKYKVYDEVAQNSNYQKYSEEQLKKEAIGKAIAKHILNQDADNEFSENLSRLERWWNKLLAKIKRLLGSPTSDPYAKAALSILNNEIQQNSADLITEEQVELGDFYQDTPKDKQENIIQRLDETAEDLVQADIDNKELGKMMKAVIDLPEGKTTKRYKRRSDDTFIQGRVSDMYQQKLIKKKGLEWMRDVNQRQPNELKRNQGTYHHSTMQNLIDYYAGNMPATKNNFEDIKKQAKFSPDTGKQIMTETQWNVIHQNVKNIVKEIKKQQRDINKETGKKGKVVIKSEAMVYAPAEDRNKYYADTAGTVDVLAIFSDGSASIYDWKFISPRQVSGFGQKARIMESPFGSKEDGYNMQIGAYKSILKQFYGVEKIRRSRIIPIHVQYKWEGMKGEKVLTPTITTLKMAFDVETETKDGKKVAKLISGDPHLSPIPVANELTQKKGLDKLLQPKLQQRAVLKAKLETEKNTQKKQALRYKIEKIDKAVRLMQMSGDISDLYAEAGTLISELEDRLPIQDKEDPEYIQLEELNEFHKEVSRAVLLTENSEEYYKNLGDTKEEKALKRNIKVARERYTIPINQMYDTLKEERANRILELADNVGIVDATRAQREFGPLKWLESDASHSHPIFQVARKYLERVNNTTRKAEKKLYEEIEEHKSKLREAFGNLQDAYKLLLNPETGNLYPKIKKEFWERRNKAFEEGDTAWAKRHYKLKKDANERFLKRKKVQFASIERNFKDYEALYEGEKRVAPRKSQKQTRDILKANFLRDNDPSSKSMWTGKYSYIYTELKEQVVEEQYSEEYLRIKNSPSLLGFYNFYIQKNKEFSELTNMNLADNFVGNIHRDVIDSLSQGGFSSKSLLKGFLENLKIRQDEVNPEHVDENGKLIQTIPLLYTSPATLIDPDTGEIDLRLKSTDLGNSLKLMGDTVYNYAEKNKIEEINLTLLGYLQDPSTETLATSPTGGLIENVAGRISKSKMGAEAADHFERLFVKDSLYGQRIQSKDIEFMGYSMNRTVSSLMSYFSASKLGLAVIPAAAAGTVGQMALWIESKKGTAYNEKQLKAARRDPFKDRNRFNTIVNYFEIWQEDMGARRALKVSAGKLVRIVSMDTLFAPFRLADNVLDNTTLTAMMRNYGVDENGMPKRLKRLPEGRKSLFEIFTVNTEEKSVFTGLSEEGEIRFREMVKYTTSSIKGSMHHDSKIAADTTLLGKLFMQFKGWAPRLIEERIGKFRYVEKTNTYEMGRYKIMRNELVDLELSGIELVKDTGVKFTKLAIEVLTFGLYKGTKMNEKRAEKEYYKHRTENLDDPHIQNMEKEDFYDMKRGQLRAMAAELQAIFALLTTIFALGMEGDDGEPIYNHTWVTRKANMILSKAMLEIGFLLNPTDLTQMVKNPIPLIGLSVDMQRWINNLTQESYEALMGIENKRDKSPFFYETKRLTPGLTQLFRLLEVHETDKRNPYDQPAR
jgi:hypothetical protein